MEDLTSLTAEAAVGYEIGKAQYQKPSTIEAGGIPFAVVPEGMSLVDVEKYLPEPVRIRASHSFYDAESFGAYVGDFDNEATRIFASVSRAEIVAILDYHSRAGAAWGDHKAVLSCAKSDDWIAWAAKDQRSMTQVQFAEFIEDQEVNFVQPAGASMLTLAQNLDISKSVIFKSAKRLSDGQTQFEYIESIEDQTKGQIKIPDKLILGIQPFKFSLAYKLTARLRFRLADGKVMFTYILDNPEKVIEAAFKDVVNAVAKATDLKPHLTA